MSDSNRVASRWVLESTPGTTPATPAFQNVCHTGAGMNANPAYIQSQKICGGGTRGIKDHILTGFDPASNLPAEWEVYALDLLLPSLFQNAWVTRNRRANTACVDPWARPTSNQITGVTGSTNVYTVSSGTAFAADDLVLATGFAESNNNGLLLVDSATATTVAAVEGAVDEASPPSTAMLVNVGKQGASGDIETTITGGNALTSTTLDFTTLGLSAGQWIKIGGSASATQFATAGLNDWVRISAVAENRVSLDVVPSAWSADAGSSKTIQLFFGDYLRDGVTRYAFTHEIHDTGIGVYRYQQGVQANTLAISGQQRAILSATLGYEAMSASSPAESRFTGATTLAEANRPSLRSGANVGRFAVGGSRLTSNFATGFTLNVTNNLRGQNAYDQDGRIGFGNGDFAPTGNINTYWETKDLLDYVMNGTDASFDVLHREPDSGGDARAAYLIDLPALKLSGDPEASGRNNDIFFNPSILGKEHGTLGYSMSLNRFHYTTDVA